MQNGALGAGQICGRVDPEAFQQLFSSTKKAPPAVDAGTSRREPRVPLPLAALRRRPR